ncbi:MAG: hypothetical protein K6A23_15580, partial [Butyrivibrio sp.]|nr:hypothetical protein [Butyrivibrio sp.]
MKKIIGLFTIATMTVGVLSACGAAAQETQSQEANTTDVAEPATTDAAESVETTEEGETIKIVTT